METVTKPVISLALSLGLCAVAFAGSGAPSATEPDFDPGNWCERLQHKPGLLPLGSENPFIQSFQIGGRFQYQAAYLDGEDVNARGFNETHGEYRRARLTVRADFLQYMSTKVFVNMVNDERNISGGDLDWGYEGIDEALLSLDLKKAFGTGPLDSLKLNYGRHKFVVSQEARTSSTKLITVERSALSNKVHGNFRPTGMSLDGAIGKWTFTGALYSSTTDGTDNAELSGWQDDIVHYASAGYQFSDGLRLGVDFVYNHADAVSEDSVIGYRWGGSINAEYNLESWGVIGDLIYGDNGGADMVGADTRRGGFWGVMVMPYCWIVGEKLQLVGQYQYGGAEQSEGIRINSRYGRATGTGAAPDADVNGGRGDQHHSFYAGLNYYLCGHNAKIQAGFEYLTMDTPIGDFDTLTYLIGFRTFF